MYLSDSTAQKQETVTFRSTLRTPTSGTPPPELELLSWLPPIMYTHIETMTSIKMFHCKDVCRVPLIAHIIKAVINSLDCSNTWYAAPPRLPMLAISKKSPRAYTNPMKEKTFIGFGFQMALHSCTPPNASAIACATTAVTTVSPKTTVISPYAKDFFPVTGSTLFEASMIVGWRARVKTKNTKRATCNAGDGLDGAAAGRGGTPWNVWAS
mmetsp:Transcript_110786/g.320156  ORF Transcript_110786/g.320156 Transcript_110786/m.320156 type:complete len:211 (-) Transcript_110786:108-740(-)